jgi:hypothetical protein
MMSVLSRTDHFAPMGVESKNLVKQAGTRLALGVSGHEKRSYRNGGGGLALVLAAPQSGATVMSGGVPQLGKDASLVEQVRRDGGGNFRGLSVC